MRIITQVEIKYLVVNGDDRDEIDVIPDFTYDKKQVGYDDNDLQNKFLYCLKI